MGARGFSHLIPDSSRRKAGASLNRAHGYFSGGRADRARVSQSITNNIFFNPKQFFFTLKVSDWTAVFVKKG